jgi:hypothetical protein
MIRALAVAATLALAGCAGHPLSMPLATDAPQPKPVIKTVVQQVCIPWREWSKADLTKLHDALVPVPDGSILIVAMRDWYRYYADAKACSDAQK